MHSRKSIWLAGIFLAALLFACKGQDTADEPATTDTPLAEKHYEYTDEDLDGSWDDANATKIALSGEGASIDGSGASSSGAVVTISQAGDYVISGTYSGAIVIDAEKDSLVRLMLNGVQIASANGPAIYAKKADKLILTLKDGTKNALSDAADYGYEAGGSEPDACVFAEEDLTVNGYGELAVTANFHEGLACRDVLAVTGGTLIVTSANDAIHGTDAVAWIAANAEIHAGNDALKATKADDTEKGFIVVDSGSFQITAEGDGFSAETALSIYGGTFELSCGGGAAAAPAEEEGGGFWGRGNMGQSGAVAEEDEEASMKAFKAGTSLLIRGGHFAVDSADDAFHSNDTLQISGGDFSIKTGDDAFHADTSLKVDSEAAAITVEQCYEGIESAAIDISAGTIDINATDDAINAAGGNDASDGQGPMGFDRFTTSDAGYYVRISGGVLNVAGGRDGIDANGDIFIEGGEVSVSGQSQGMEGAIDLDGSLTLTGGRLITAGSVSSIGSDSTQYALLVSFASSHPSGAVIELKKGEETLISYTSRIAFSAAAFSTPELGKGDGLSVYVDGEKTLDATLSAVATQVGENGTYNVQGGGMNNWGGGKQGGGQQGGTPGGKQGGNQGTTPDDGTWDPSQGGTPPTVPEGGGYMGPIFNDRRGNEGAPSGN